MAGRNIVLATDSYYHVFNRGVARQPVFYSKRDYERFTLTFSYYRYSDPPVKYSRLMSLSTDLRTEIIDSLAQRNKPIIQIVSYVLMPNHFHFILKQTREKGISIFMSKLTNSFTKYVNTKQERVGDLFQGVFKATQIETDEQLIHLSRYIHINPIVSGIINQKQLFTYPWSSLSSYIHPNSGPVESGVVMDHFKNAKAYQDFLTDQVDYGKQLEALKHLIIEN